MKHQPRVLIAGLFHETHTFLPGETKLSDCEILIGDQLLGVTGDATSLGGALEIAAELGWDVLPAIDIRTIPGAICADEIIEFWWRSVQDTLRANQPQPDATFLVLHGAMVSQSFDDVEGEILERVRTYFGSNIPIGGVTDLHANFSAKMASNSNCLVTYRENPHTDARATAQHAALLLNSLLQSGQSAETHFRQIPVIWPPTGTATAYYPMRGLETLARSIEEANPEILAVNIHAGYSFSDVPDAGVSFTVVSSGDKTKAERALDQLEKLALESYQRGNVIDPSFYSLLPDIRAHLQAPQSGPVVLAEPSDNIGGGAPGDGTGLLQEFVDHQIGGSLVIVNDPITVEQLQGMEIGARSTLKIGNASAFNGARPLELEITLLSRSDGNFELEDPQSHPARLKGKYVEMGHCVTVCHRLPNSEEVLILLTSRPTAPFDLGQLRSQGIQPEKLKVIGVKAAVAHRRAYETIASALFSVATPGPCSSDLKMLPYQQVRRPIFPLDALS